jgi:hypothetical protein
MAQPVRAPDPPRASLSALGATETTSDSLHTALPEPPMRSVPPGSLGAALLPSSDGGRRIGKNNIPTKAMRDTCRVDSGFLS